MAKVTEAARDMAPTAEMLPLRAAPLPLDISPDVELLVRGKRYRLVPVEAAAAGCKLALAATDQVASILTPRELQIATLVAEGLVNKQIGDCLGISEWTVSTHLRRAFTKLGVDTRAALVCKCFGVRTHAVTAS